MQDALRVVSQVQESLRCHPLRPGQLTRLRQVQIPVGSKLVYEAENMVHDTSSIEVYLQVRAMFRKHLCTAIIPCMVVDSSRGQWWLYVAIA